MQNIKLAQLPPIYKKIIALYLLIQTVGVLTGLVLVANISQNSLKGIAVHYRGEEIADPLEIPDTTPKPLMSMLITTHSHLLALSQIFLIMGLLVLATNCNKAFVHLLAIEPFISLGTTFGGLWLVRYFHPNFVYLVIVSSACLYISYFLQVGVVFYSILKQK